MPLLFVTYSSVAINLTMIPLMISFSFNSCLMLLKWIELDGTFRLTLQQYVTKIRVSTIHAFDLALQFSREWQILLFHYDGKVSEWDDLEWSRNVIHISARKQAKWYVSLRFFLSTVASYTYVSIIFSCVCL